MERQRYPQRRSEEPRRYRSGTRDYKKEHVSINMIHVFLKPEKEEVETAQKIKSELTYLQHQQ